MSGKVEPVSPELCDIALDPENPMLLPAVLYHHAPFEETGVFSAVACFTTAADDTAPSEKHVAVLTLRAAIKINGPAHAAIAADDVAVPYVVGKPAHGVQPCATSSSAGTL